MLDVLAIGTATRDVFLHGALFKTIHDPKHLKRLGIPTGDAQCFALGGKIEVDEPVLTIGGGACNAAVTFARQGLSAAAMLKIGRDPNGQAVLEDIRREKVRGVPLFDPKKGTSYSVVLLSPQGERTILNYRGASEDMGWPEFRRALPAARWAYFVTGHISFPVVTRVVSRLDQKGMCIALAPSGYHLSLGAKKLAKIFKVARVVMLNREEASLLTKVPYERRDKVFEAFRRLCGGIAVMTDGHDGVLVWDGIRRYEAGVYQEKKIVDRTGSGDAFGSGFAAVLARYPASGSFPQRVIEEAIRAGSANATSVVEHVGAQGGILTRRQLASQPRWRKFAIGVRQAK